MRRCICVFVGQRTNFDGDTKLNGEFAVHLACNACVWPAAWPSVIQLGG
jgi:hypothetical protein